MAAMTPGRNLSMNDNTMKPNPIAAITWNSNILNCKSYQSPKLMTVNSRITSQIPLEIKNRLVAAILFLFFKEIKTDVPDKKTKTGAQ